MRIQYLSDLRFEFMKDAGASFMASLDPSDIDVLVVAGDLAVGEGIGPALDLVCKRFPSSTVLYVHGNHEYYGTTRETVVAITRAACARNDNLRWLDCTGVEIDGRTFLGAPMWFRHAGPSDEYKLGMNDFRVIQDLERWVYGENERALSFFESEMRAGDVVITHHLPSQACVLPQWKGHPLNPFFVCDVERLIRERRPALWIHGHTHDTVDVTLEATRIVCNPFGYVRIEENAKFAERAVVEL